MLATAQRPAQTRPTVLLIFDDEIQPTQLSFAWRDAIDEIFGAKIPVTHVWVLYPDGRWTDVTRTALKDVCRMTHDKRRTPVHLEHLLWSAGLDYFDDDTPEPRDPNTEHRLTMRELV